ncbi:MAG TPA: BMP family ABC transporter substrate-binding protein [Blastocatellia bacterium]|jgi:basic membrane protein A|nr:BMP family ABC transporter substrate-binding protein [Blastocatellia bacterium]HAF24342.1 BMP family ABC transporter substrate-binding protein [Blastocatellia bacterium]HCX31241.1 BMP family ABC transporter substrate-binding protein [Blastocatellia bacterium]
MKFVFWSMLLGLCLLAVFSSACNHSSYGADDKSKVHVGIVYDIGGKDDRSFNAAAFAGVKCAESGKWPNGESCGKPALNIVLRDIEPGNPTSIEPAMRAFAERGYDLIIGVGFAQAPIIEQVAKEYPNIHFAIVDGVSELPNVASLVFKEHEGSYLVGMLAAKTTKTGTLGFVGGMDIPLIHRFETGYEEGARAVNPNIRIIQNYVGVTDSAWNNPGKGKELALAQIGKGADVIFTAAGNSGLGAFDAVEQAGKQNGRATHFVIGVDSNQNMVKPGFVLTSMVKRVDNAVYSIVEDVVKGKFQAGFHVYGLDKDGVGYAMDQFNKDLISPEMIQQTEEARKKIINGEIKVTDAMTK